MPPFAEMPAAAYGRWITFAEVARTSEVPVDTIAMWHRLIVAMGYEFGQKVKGAWHFDSREFFLLSIAGSLSRAGYPVGAEVLRQIILGSQKDGRPDKPLLIKTPATFAIIAVDAPRLWDTMVQMISRAEENAA